MGESYYCNICLSELKEISGCGAVNYFCTACKGLVSRSSMLTEPEVSLEQSE